MITRRKKTKTTVSINPQTSKEDFNGIPQDLVFEILGRLPVKSVARFLLVSKLWARIIRSKDFIKSFPLGSSSQPRLLIAFGGLDRRGGNPGRGLRQWDPRMDNWCFFSSALSSSSFLSRSPCPLPCPVSIEYHSHYVNGFLSVGYGQEQFIVNPTTGKSTALPRVKTRRKVAISFFGYDPVNDQYKALCMTEKLYGYPQKPSSQHQVFTLGDDKQKSWRMIECSIPHRPWSNGVCIDGVVYYVSKTGDDLSQHSLMRFDLRSEKLDLVTGVPAGAILSYEAYGQYFILNYEGKVAIPFQATAYTFDVWVMDQGAEKQEWLKKITFSIEPWKSLYLNRLLRVRGITRTGEFILVPQSCTCNKVYVVHYNHDTDSFRKIMVHVSAGSNSRLAGPRATVFMDYVESVRFL